jgi:beta-fructofuranosidase
MKNPIVLFALYLAMAAPAFAQNKVKRKTAALPKNASPVPRFQFAETLEEQEKQLADNALLARFRESRAELLNDRHHPIYHFVSSENRLNDPNGLCIWNGQWHMFYQGYPPEHPRQHWGHTISDDLIHWRDLPYAIYPGPENACFWGLRSRPDCMPHRRIRMEKVA